MKTAALLALILLLGAIEATLPRLFHLDAARPMLLLPLVFLFALRWGTLEGAALSVVVGFVHEAAGGSLPGPGAFTAVALFVGSRLALMGLHAEGRWFEAAFTFALALAWHALTTAVEAAFGPPHARVGDTPWLSLSLWSALATAAASPLVLWAARRVEALARERPPGALK